MAKETSFFTSETMAGFLSKNALDMAICVVALLVGVYLDWSLRYIAVFLAFIWFVLNPWGAALLAKSALFLFFLGQILVLMRKNERAEDFVMLGYLALTLAVVMAVVEYRQEAKGADEHTS